MGHRHQPSSPSPAAEHPLEDDDLLREILLRLPPQPPYLLRASLVAKRWRHIAIDPKFLRRFRIHHRKPPLLGDFSYEDGRLSFRSTLDLPYRIPPDHFSLQVNGREPWRLVDCRHGRVLLINRERRQVIVWDPVTGDRSLLSVPPEFEDMHTAAVLCAAGEQGHAHGACHSSPFKVVVVDSYSYDDEAVVLVSVYSSDTGVWSDLLSTRLASWGIMGIVVGNRSTLVGNTLHWLLLMSNNILQFDLDRQTLAVINRPPCASYGDSVQIIEVDDGGVGFSALSCTRCPFPCDHQPCFQMWDRKVNCNGVAVWVLRKSIKLRKLLGLGFKIDRARIVRYVEDVHALFLWVHSSLFMVQLESMQPKELFKSDNVYTYYPFTSFYDKGVISLKQK